MYQIMNVFGFSRVTNNSKESTIHFLGVSVSHRKIGAINHFEPFLVYQIAKKGKEPPKFKY